MKLENKEIDRLLEHFKNLILATVDNPKAQMSYDEKIKVLKDLEGKYKTKSVVVNELYYRYFKLSFEEKRIPDFLKFMAAYKVFTSSNKIIPDRKKMFSYVNIICDFDYDVECKAEIVYLSKLYKYSSLEPRLQERYFYILLKEGKLTSAYRVGLRISKLRKDFDYINPVSSLIMISDIGDVFKLVESKYALEKDRNIVLDLIEDHLIYRYSKDVNETKYIKKCIQLNPQKCQSLSKLASAYTQQAKFKMKLPPPFNNDEEVVFEKFGLELSNKMNTIQEETKKLEEFIKELDPRIQSLSFFIGIKYYEDLIRNFSLFIPKSEEVALVEAINGEMNNIKSIFAKKKEEYIISSKKIRSKVKDNSGASLLALPLKNRSDLSSEMGSLFLIRSEL